MKDFRSIILEWYEKNKRDTLPWRKVRNPYHILVSEIMLQQTQVSRVLIKYPEFLSAFPTMRDLALSPLEVVLVVWQGMGYNRRALYLKQAAGEVIEKYRGVIPSDIETLKTLSGVGSYTAGAIACFAFNQPSVFLDTNIRKVFIHFFFAQKEKVSDKEILPLVEKYLLPENPRDWYYALMDYGSALLVSKNNVGRKAKNYRKQSSFVGSTRYFRSKILRHILMRKSVSEGELVKEISQDNNFNPSIDPTRILLALEKETFIVRDKNNNYNFILEPS